MISPSSTSSTSGTGSARTAAAPGTYTQDTRTLAVETPLGKDALLLTALTGREEMSRPFTFELAMLSERDNISHKDLVGRTISFCSLYADGSPRWFSGVVSRFAFQGTGDRLSRYHAQIVPWLWLLAQTADCRIFQSKSAPDIIQQIFSENGFNDFDISEIRGDHPKRDYCVQYRETDFNFVSRLMEEEGIFYFFRHDKGRHTMVLADQKRAYADARDSQLEFVDREDATQPFDHLSNWEHQYELRTGKWAHTDYNFETPSVNLMANTQTLYKVGNNTSWEIYDYPGLYDNKGRGDTQVRIRMEEEEAGYEVIHGASNCRSFSPGYKFKLSKHRARGEEGKTYVITSIRHSGSVGTTYLTGAERAGTGYSNTFTAIPESVVFRPARTTPKPVVQGIQTALVVGPSGEEIYTDKYGRIKVQFYWDRQGKKNDKSSCWMRVATPWVGTNWGAIHIPRIGQEVVVSFLEGDPDRPLVTGSVYNAERMPPYALPDNKTQSGVKSNSTKGGGGSNELRFEDKKSSEDIYFHAQKDFHRVVEHDDDLKVGNDYTGQIQNNRTITVTQGDDTHEIQQGNRQVTIDMGNDTLTIKMGNQTTKLDLGSSSTEALQSIELKVGQSSVKLDQMGVTISGMMIKIDGQIQTQVHGTMTQISGDAMLQLSGGITMIG